MCGLNYDRNETIFLRPDKNLLRKQLQDGNNELKNPSTADRNSAAGRYGLRNQLQTLQFSYCGAHCMTDHCYLFCRMNI